MPVIINLWRETFYFSSQFWRFQSMTIWLYSFRPAARQHIIREQNHSLIPEDESAQVPQATSRAWSITRRLLVRTHFLKAYSWPPLVSPGLMSELPDWFNSENKLLLTEMIQHRNNPWYGPHHWRGLLKGNRPLILIYHNPEHDQEPHSNMFGRHESIDKRA